MCLGLRQEPETQRRDLSTPPPTWRRSPHGSEPYEQLSAKNEYSHPFVYVQLKSQHKLNSGSDQHTEVATPSQREMFGSHHNQLLHIIKVLNKLYLPNDMIER
jgi:hypothetical protein